MKKFSSYSKLFLLLITGFFLVVGIFFYAIPLKKLIAETPALDYRPIDFKEPKDIMIFDKESKNFLPFTLPSMSSENALPLSIIIPIHNVEDYLVECLDSVVKQNNKQYEVILVENNSTDNSLEIAKSYAEKYENIILIKQDGGSVGGARNTGMMVAKGEYITFLDSDDFFVDDAINIAINAIEKDKFEMVVFSFYYYDNLKNKVNKKYKLKFTDQEIIKTQDYKFIDIHSPLYAYGAVWAKLYKRKFLTKSGILFKNNLFYEDTLFLFMLSTQDMRIKFHNTQLLYYRTNRFGSIMAKVPNINHMITVYKEFKNFLKEQGKYDLQEALFLDSEIKCLNRKAKFLYNKEAIAVYKYLHNYYKEQKFEERGIKPVDPKNLKLFNKIMNDEYFSIILLNNIKTFRQKHSG